MTRDGVANLNRVEYVMRAIGRMEDSIFKKRREDECRRRIRDEKRKHQNKNHRQFGDKARNEGRNEVNDMVDDRRFNNDLKSGLQAPMAPDQRANQVAKSAREIRQEAAQARLAAAKHEDNNMEQVTLSALA